MKYRLRAFEKIMSGSVDRSVRVVDIRAGSRTGSPNFVTGPGCSAFGAQRRLQGRLAASAIELAHDPAKQVFARRSQIDRSGSRGDS